MEFDELLDERQADTEAFLVHPAIGCDLRENVENGVAGEWPRQGRTNTEKPRETGVWQTPARGSGSQGARFGTRRDGGWSAVQVALSCDPSLAGR